MINGIFICNKININESNNYNDLDIQNIEPLDFPFTTLSYSIKEKTYDIIFKNLYNSEGTNRLTGILSVNDGSFNDLNNNLIKKIYKLNNTKNGGYFIIYNNESAILMIYGKNIKYINFMIGYIYKNKVEKVNQGCNVGKCVLQ